MSVSREAHEHEGGFLTGFGRGLLFLGLTKLHYF
jgi:hypothetical protein